MAEGAKNQAIGKLLSERPAHPDAIERALGRVWCPVGGIECKGLGDNKFLVTFNQISGRRKAIEEGPWMFSNELLVMVEVDEEKSIEELEFSHIPIWIRVSNLPMGLMNAEVGEKIGNEVGEFLEVEKDNGEVALGKFMRIKIKLDIRRPLMRGVTVKVGKEGKEKWCPVVYEYLPDFCYVCGLIGHTDKRCNIKLGKGEKQPFDKGLRCIPSRSMGDGDNRGRRQQYVPSGNGAIELFQGKRERNSTPSGSRSDALSWRKNEASEKETLLVEKEQDKVHEQSHAKRVKEKNYVEKEKDGVFQATVLDSNVTPTPIPKEDDGPVVPSELSAEVQETPKLRSFKRMARENHLSSC